MSKPLLVYDGECPMCIGLTRLYLHLGWVSADRRIAFQDVEGELAVALVEAGIRNEMAVVEPDSGRILSGVPGLFRLLEETWARPFVRLLDRPVLREICVVLYRFIGFNRRFLSLPRPRAIRCACEPDPHAGYNLALVALALALTAAAVAGTDRVWSARAPALPIEESLLLLGRALILLLFLGVALTVPPALRLRALGHASMGLLYSALLLALAALLSLWLPDERARAWLFAAGVLVLPWLWRFMARRFRYLALSRPGLRALVLATLGSLALSLRSFVSVGGQ
jgi:predicted DCC family thiol-disulfide oxidoreductase YuxK